MEDPLATAAAKYHAAHQKAEALREDLANEIRAAALIGRRQVEIVKVTGYTREQVRRIVAGRTR